MGLSDWLARKGAVGGTARWAAELYHEIIRDYPDWTHSDIIPAIIDARYLSDRDAYLKQSLIEGMELSAHATNADGVAHPGLSSLVTNILRRETQFEETSLDNKLQFIRIVEEELKKSGVPQYYIYDYVQTKAEQEEIAAKARRRKQDKEDKALENYRDHLRKTRHLPSYPSDKTSKTKPTEPDINKEIIECNSCGGKLRVTKGKFGKIRCPICKELFEIVSSDFHEVDPSFKND